MDTHTKDYVDANMRAVKAENSANFAKLEAKIDGIMPGATWQQNAITAVASVVVGLGLVFAVLSYASDRFDGGIAASGLLDEFRQEQRSRDKKQNEALSRILTTLEAIRGGPKASTQDGQD